MSRIPTAGMEAKLDQKCGTEPLMVLRVDWPTGSLYYADKSFSIGAISVLGKITEVNDLNIVRYQESYGAIGSVSITMDDADRHFYNLMNTQILVGLKTQLYHYYPGLAASDLFPLFSGRITSPVNWDESNRYLSFDIANTFDENNVGEELPNPSDWVTPNQITPIRDEFEGVFPPIVFGSCLAVPCPRLHTAGETQTLEPIHFEYDIAERTTSVLVQDASQFSSGSIWVTIGDVNFAGGFSMSEANKFIISTYNIPTILDQAECYRLVDDEDSENYNVVWIETTAFLKNTWVLFNDIANGYFVNYCVDQLGEKFFFREPFARSYPNYDDAEVGPFLILVNDSAALQSAAKYHVEWPEWASGVWQTEVWDIPAGAIFKEQVEPVYIINYIPNTTIKAVYAYRNVPEYFYEPETNEYKKHGTKKILSAVPSNYYTKYSSRYVNGKPMTIIVMRKPLSQYIGEGWEDEIYVTMASPVGPNTANIIKWILQNFTTLTIDTTSFDAVAAKIGRYPSCFALFEQHKAIELCQDIAWQARCGLTVYNNTAYLSYLSEEPASLKTIDNSMIQFKTLGTRFSDIDDMYTKITAKYQKDYLPKKDADTDGELVGLSVRNNKKKLIYQNNIAQFGLREVTWDFFIYNHPTYVRKSFNFWANRYANCWKKATLTSFLTNLDLDLFDCVTLSLPTVYPFGLTSMKGIVEEWSYNSDSKLIDLVLSLPIKAGTTSIDPNYWISDVDGILAMDLTAGVYELNYRVTTDFDKFVKKFEEEDAEITNITNEVDEAGAETGRKLYDVDVHKYGHENEITTQHVEARPLIINTDFEVGDKVKVTQKLNQFYLEPVQPIGTSWFQIVSKEDDFLTCLMYDEFGEIIPDVEVNVVKPHLLRRSLFDEQTVNGIAYVYTDNETRTATEGSEDPITEQVTPAYYVGEKIIADRFIHGGTFSDDAIAWIARNDRVWVAEATGGGGVGAVYSTTAVATTNIALTGAQTIDGQSVIAGNQVLVSGQTTASENGVYICAAGAWTKVTGFAATTAATIIVQKGTLYAETIWLVSALNTVKASGGVWK